MATEKALRYDGGGSLTFHDGTGARRTIQGGHPFLVDSSTARVLLEDPKVVEVDADEVEREVAPATAVVVDQGRPPEVEQTPPQLDLTTATKAALLEYAGLLGLTLAKSTTVAKAREAIEVELKRRQELKAPVVDPVAAALVDAPRGNAPAAFAEFAAVKARAKELGIPVKGKRAELEAAIAAAEAQLSAPADGGDQGGGATPGDDSEASATDEPGTPPSSTGAITLGDLPDSAKLKG